MLDEPTNHLDLDAVEALIHALINFEGGLLVISHDQHLVESICEELWVASPGKVDIFKAPFAEYRKQQLKLLEKKRGMSLSSMRKAVVDVSDDAPKEAKEAPKPKAKIELMKGGSMSRA